ncbi:MAG: sigma-70 family RNA polymerase sigma factor [Ferruginibacter sp.]
MLPANNKTIPLAHIISESIVGNTRMQEILYHKFSVTMYYLCLRFVKNTADAEDVLQEGFIKVFKNLDKYKDEGSFEGWIRKIITRTAISYLRDNKKYQVHCGLEDSIVDKETNILDKLAEKEIAGIVTKLPPGSKRIFMLYVIEGYNHREIAEILGCSEGTCKSQFYRSRIRIQKLLKQTA